MVRIPSLSRRTAASTSPEPAATAAPSRDENGDGRIDGRDTRDGVVGGRDTRDGVVGGQNTGDGGPAARAGDTAALGTARPGTATAAPTGEVVPPGERATYRSSSAGPATTTTPVVDRPRTVDTRDDDTRADGPERVDGPDRVDERTTGTERVDRKPAVVAPAGPRPRASLLATLSLILGVAAVLFVLTGTLAGYGIAIGAVGSLLGVAGISATSRRHVAGKSEALLGLVLGLGAVVLGILAMTGQFTWPTTDGDWVLRFREWLDSQFVDRF